MRLLTAGSSVRAGQEEPQDPAQQWVGFFLRYIRPAGVGSFISAYYSGISARRRLFCTKPFDMLMCLRQKKTGDP